jgi:23S rRNA G2445 N2-methylase RlmL
VQLFATSLPGFGPILRDEIAARGLPAEERVGFDGRNDVVPFTGAAGRAVLELRTSEDVFVQLAQAAGNLPLRPLVRKLASAPLDEALDALRRARGRRGRATTFRVIVRVRGERRFLRTELRDALTRELASRRPQWRVRDPAALEFWALEVQPGVFRLGLRLTTSAMRSRGGRLVERPGALRPSAAAALCVLAGDPHGRLLDPFCGSGTILLEARELRWQPIGGDIDPKAVEAAGANLGPDVRVEVWDARRLPLADASVEAVASNLPFGKQYRIQGRQENWAGQVLGELVRVTKPSSPIVLLAPDTLVGGALARSGLRAEKSYRVRVLGQATHVWRLRAS